MSDFAETWIRAQSLSSMSIDGPFPIRYVNFGSALYRYHSGDHAGSLKGKFFHCGRITEWEKIGRMGGLTRVRCVYNYSANVTSMVINGHYDNFRDTPSKLPYEEMDLLELNHDVFRVKLPGSLRGCELGDD